MILPIQKYWYVLHFKTRNHFLLKLRDTVIQGVVWHAVKQFFQPTIFS